MSESPDPNLPHEAASAAPLALPPSSHDVESDIADEIGDHLSLAARDLQLAGHPAEEAHQLAAKKFGDVTTIRRRLWWIQKGDEVMLRIGFAILMTVVILAVAGLGIGGWQMSRTLDDVGGTLAALKESQRSFVPTHLQSNRMPEVTGVCYVGDRSRPAKNVEVQIYELPKRELVRRVLTDERGNFASGYMPNGAYTVIAPLVGDANPLYEYYPYGISGRLSPVYRIQSGLVGIHSGAPSAPIDLDLQMPPVGEVTFELAKPFPDLLEHQNEQHAYLVDVKMAMFVEHDVPSLPITNPIVHKDDARIQTIGVFQRDLEERHRFDAKDFQQPVRFPKSAPLSEGKYQVGTFVVIDTDGRIGGRFPQSFDLRVDVLKSAGALIDVDVKAGQRAQLRITPPEGLEEVYRAAILTFEKLDRMPEEEKEKREIQREMDAALDQLYDARPAKLEFVGYVPMDAGGAKKAAE